METVLRLHQCFEHEKRVHRRINLNNVTERTAAATGVNRNLVCKICAMEDVSSWRKLPCLPITVSRKQTIPENFSSVVRQTIQDIYLEDNHVTTPNNYSWKTKTERSSGLWAFKFISWKLNVWPRQQNLDLGPSTLHRLMKSIGFTNKVKISHYGYPKNRADVISMRDDYLDRISQ